MHLFILFNDERVAADADLAAEAAAAEADLADMAKKLIRLRISNEKEKYKFEKLAAKNEKMIKDNKFVVASNVAMSAIAIGAMAGKKGFRISEVAKDISKTF